MFCPQCGQRQTSNEARFCSSCGFQLHAVGDLLKTGGLPLAPRAQDGGQLSPRERGKRQAAMMMLSTLVIVPLMGIIGASMLGLPGELVAATAVVLMMGGFLRLMYAVMFESSVALDQQPTHAPQQYVPPASVPNYLGTPHAPASLPPQRGVPVNAYNPPRRFDTGEIAPPSSVTDHTTRLLDKQPDESSRE